MNLQEPHEPVLSVADEQVCINSILRAIAEQFDIVMGNPARVSELCTRLKNTLDTSSADSLIILLPLLTKRKGLVAKPVFDLLEEFAPASPSPSKWVKGLFFVIDESLARRALELAVFLIKREPFTADPEWLITLAEQADIPGKPLNDPIHFEIIEQLIRELHPNSTDPVRDLFLNSTDGRLRRLAARILDKKNEPVSEKDSEKILGHDAQKVLAPYLTFTRTSHLELLSLVPFPDQKPPSIGSICSARELLGENLFRQILTELGWQRMNLGLEVRRYVRFSIGDSIPLTVRPSEAAFLSSCGEPLPTSEVFTVIAHGSASMEEASQKDGVDPATRFRLYNMAHAELLSGFLAVAPLTAEKIQTMLLQMDRIVRDFIELFSEFTEDCSLLPGIYDRLRSEIRSEMDLSADHGPISAELTRLVMMFEDPRAIGDVRTLHGLKRYLHQKGLQLGFRLVLRSRSTNRTVDVLLIADGRVMPSFKSIQYADFEPEPGDPSLSTPIPYSVSVVAEGFLRQLLYGRESFPRVDIFCYGNEVHYYLSFRNHPAFLRINYAPPLQGGMIDLEYFGVSKYELSVHPDLSLEALRKFFQYLEFDIEIENTRVHARYDKEHAHDLESLCHKAEGIFRLAPYLLDIDWTIGSLQLSSAARKKVADAWAASFAHWGILPLRDILSADRTGIVYAVEETPSGKKEILWDGDTDYADRMILRPNDLFYDKLCRALDDLNVGITPARTEEGHRRFGQIRIERWLLQPLRKAVARGELIESPGGFSCISDDRFMRVHEAEYFIQMLLGNSELLINSMMLAGHIEPLERALDFRTTGFIGNHTVQFARLPLCGDELGLFILRGEKNAVRLAFYTHGTVLFKKRKPGSDAWLFNASCDVSELVKTLRRTGYPVDGSDAPAFSFDDAERFRTNLKEMSFISLLRPIEGEHLISGLSASPGRAVGRVLFEITGKKPQDLDGHVLLASAIRPEDNAYLYHAEGIISTGGGILSHAGLLANQFHKPAVIISGQWEQGKNAPSGLRYTSLEYDLEEKEIGGYRMAMRRRIREREYLLTEDDVLVVEAGDGIVRVLGQEPDTLALHEGLVQFAKASRELARSSTDHDLLTLRGRRLRARHQIEKILSRLTNPALACHALYELLLSRDISNRYVPVSEKAQLFELVMNNPAVGDIAKDHLRRSIYDMQERLGARLKKALAHIPVSGSIYEILNLRIEVLQTARSLNEAVASLQTCGLWKESAGITIPPELDRITKERISALYVTSASLLQYKEGKKPSPGMRHGLRDADRMASIINPPQAERESLETLRKILEQNDKKITDELSNCNIIHRENSGFELHALIGWKAANLGEIGKLTEPQWVPPWFAVTDHAFRSILNAPLRNMFKNIPDLPEKAETLDDGIRTILDRSDLDPVQKSLSIGNLWEAVLLSDELMHEIISAYHALERPSGDNDNEPYVAIRSSSREEDAEAAARAGEFETFLYIKGATAVLDHIKRTWSGLWSERAIHNRSLLGHTASVTGGGVIVQRMVHSRVSGVMQTVNVGRNDMREMVINAGLGLGEGIVSGTVSADQITVSKDQDPAKEHLNFVYITANKKQFVVFDKRTGFGTIRCEAPFHQRLRPALEYVELCELVAKARELESAYGYPLDIEFAVEGTTIWILQVRPVPSFIAAVQETLLKYSLNDDPASAKCEGEIYDQT